MQKPQQGYPKSRYGERASFYLGQYYARRFILNDQVGRPLINSSNSAFEDYIKRAQNGDSVTRCVGTCCRSPQDHLLRVRGHDGAGTPSTPESFNSSKSASHRVHYFSSSHEKVIVIDDEWSLVQSGNYSENSIPLNVEDGGDRDHFRSGNRDTGLAIRSRKLAKFFSQILESDMALGINSPEALAKAAKAANAFLIERAPTKIPTELFPSKTFRLNKTLNIQPVLSPDNYMDVVPDKLRVAKKSILIEQQYIRGSQDKIADLLDAIKEARKDAPKLDIRIILGKLFNRKDLEKERKNLALLKREYGLTLGKNIRYIGPADLFTAITK
jgi:hypothetical protein